MAVGHFRSSSRDFPVGSLRPLMSLPTTTTTLLEPARLPESTGGNGRLKLLIVLCVYSLIVWVLVSRESGTLGWFDGQEDKNTSLTLLIDLDCLRALQTRQACRGPVRVATGSYESGWFEQKHANYFNVTHEVEYWVDRDYLMFSPLKRGPNEKYGRRAVPSEKQFYSQDVNFTDGRSFRVYVPTNISQFERHWTNGRFIECLGSQMNRTDKKSEISLEEASREFANFRQFFDKLESTTFLFAGTLLGWYRECSIIPHTKDVDFAFHAADLTESLLTRIESTYSMVHKLGAANDSLELTLYLGDVRTDLFVFYPLNETNSYYTVLDFYDRRTMMAVCPQIARICTGDLLGVLVYVPCNVEDVLNVEYGADWRNDRPTGGYNYLKAPNVVPFLEHTAAEFDKRVVNYEK